MRKTPYMRLRYPFGSDVVNPVDVQTTAADMDQAMVGVANLQFEFPRLASVYAARNNSVLSVAKATVVTIPFDTLIRDTGTGSPASNGAWYSNANPSRMTAPVPCVVLAVGSLELILGSALGANGAIEAIIALNGATTYPGIQETKWNPSSADTGNQTVQLMSMWKLNAGDFLELKVRWTGTPAGPLNVNNLGNTFMQIIMVALPTPIP